MKPKFGVEDMDALGFLITAAGGLLGLLIFTITLTIVIGGNPYQVP